MRDSRSWPAGTGRERVALTGIQGAGPVCGSCRDGTVLDSAWGMVYNYVDVEQERGRCAL
jgi:hypothetical protein